MNKSKQLIHLSAVLAIVSSPVFADAVKTDDRGWYIGGSFGNAEVSTQYEDTAELTEKPVNFGVYGGYDFNNWFALESAFTSTNEFRYHKATDIKGNFGALTITPKLTANVSDDVAFYVKAGFASMVYMERDSYYRDTTTWGGIGSTFGIGAEINVSDHMRLRISYDYLNGSLEDQDDYFSDIDTTSKQISLGLQYQF